MDQVGGRAYLSRECIQRDGLWLFRYTVRMIPVQRTCYSSMEELAACAKVLFTTAFKGVRPHSSVRTEASERRTVSAEHRVRVCSQFAVLWDKRSLKNKAMDRSEAIPLLSSLVL